MEKTQQPEKIITTDVQLDTQELQQFTEQMQDQVASATSWEIILVAGLPLLAFIIGHTLNRRIDRRPKESLSANFLDFIGPLIAPLLAIIFIMIAGFTMRFMELERHLIPFVWKLCVAWFAIRLVVMMSSRQSAGWFIALVIIPITLLHLFGIWEPITEALEGISFKIGKVKFNAFLILQSVAAIVALIWITGFIVQSTDKRLRRVRRLHVSNRMLIMKIFQIVIYFIVFLVGLQVLGVDFTALSVLGGALGVGIGFGLQKIASNFISGIILLFEKSVSVDDMIQLEDGTTGFIRQNAARYTLIELADGREVMIPNEEFITNRVTTLTHSNRRGQFEINLLLHFDTDIDLALKLLVEAGKSHSSVLADPAPGAYVTAFEDNGIRARLLLWLEDITAGTYGVRTQIIKETQRLFRENGIVIAYPHQVAASDEWGKSIGAIDIRVDKKRHTNTETALKPPKDKA